MRHPHSEAVEACSKLRPPGCRCRTGQQTQDHRLGMTTLLRRSLFPYVPARCGRDEARSERPIRLRKEPPTEILGRWQPKVGLLAQRSWREWGIIKRPPGA